MYPAPITFCLLGRAMSGGLLLKCDPHSLLRMVIQLYNIARSVRPVLVGFDDESQKFSPSQYTLTKELTDTKATIRSLKAQITTLEDAAITADNAKATANLAEAAELKAAVKSATKELIDNRATEVETAVSTAKPSTIEASRNHMIELVAFETVLKHFFKREWMVWSVDNLGESFDAAGRVVMGLLGTNVDTSARLCGASDMKILQQRANELVELIRIPTSMDITQLVEDMSEALPSRPSLTPAATGPRLTRLPREDTSPFGRHASRNPDQSSRLGESYEATELTATSPELHTLVRLLKRGYRSQYNSKGHNEVLSASMGEGHDIMFYNLYAMMVEGITCVDEKIKMDFIEMCITDIHHEVFQLDEKLVKRTLAKYSRAEISDFNSK